MTNNPADDPAPTDESGPATDAPEPEEPTTPERTAPPRVGAAIPDSVVFVQPPPVT
ncbi:hypothetical protein [Nocardia sp. NPDC051570]|uniref:hypothetical protein n=1 Tax=Nocardia sp. NPDC051570 TaxID=3364324 RepID=UPI0037B3594F